MRKSLWIIALALTALLAPTVLRAQTTYNMDLTVGSGSVVGTITTDGDIGTLSTADIVAWSLTVNDGTSIENLYGPTSGNNSIEYIVGGDVSATSTQLLFNFSGADGGYLVFEINPSGQFACFIAGPAPTCYNTDTPPDISLGNTNTDVNIYTAPLSGDQVIASTTPEPGTFSLMLLGIGGALLMLKRIG